MKKQSILYVLGYVFLILNLSCSDDSSGLGGCSVACGGLGTGQPFTQTDHRFISEADCIKKGEEKSHCRVSYCPPTGDPDDCYRVN